MAEVTNEEYELVPVGALREHPDNPRRGNVEEIVASIEKHGFVGSLVVQRSSSYVLAGNHRLKAAKKAGLERVPVIWLEVGDVEAKKILLADNRTSDLGGYDDTALVELLGQFSGDLGFEGTGYSSEDFSALLEPPGPPERPPGLGEAVIATQLVFDTEDQQQCWYRFGRYLKKRYPEAETLSERLCAYIEEEVPT